MSEAREYRSVPQSTQAIIDGYIDARPVEYHGVTMRSRLERDFAFYLDLMGVKWRYEPAIYGPNGEGYLPDFQIVSSTPTFVELKPLKADVREAARRMEVIWETHPDAVLIVACGEGSTFYTARKGQPWRSFVELWKHR